MELENRGGEEGGGEGEGGGGEGEGGVFGFKWGGW